MKQIQKAINKWTYCLGLRWWNITIVWISDPKEIIETFTEPGNGELLTLASTCTLWQYAEATIKINLPAFENIDDYRIERIVIHELCHVLVNEMREGELHHEERVVTGLVKAFAWTFEEGKKAEK